MSHSHGARRRLCAQRADPDHMRAQVPMGVQGVWGERSVCSCACGRVWVWVSVGGCDSVARPIVHACASVYMCVCARAACVCCGNL